MLSVGAEDLKRDLSNLSVQLAPVVGFAFLSFPSLRLVSEVIERLIIHIS